MPRLSARGLQRGSLCAAGCALTLSWYGAPLPAQDAGPSRAAVARSVCRSAGRLACDLPPSGADPEALCAQLTACLENRRFSEGLVKSVGVCQPLAAQTKLDDARVQALGTVSAIVEDLSGRQYHAAYLLGRIDQGWCVLDELFDPLWSPNSCAATFRLRTRAATADQPTQAEIAGERTCYDTRDQAELARGESNVRSVACVEARYAIQDGGVKRTAWQERDEACKPRRDAR